MPPKRFPKREVAGKKPPALTRQIVETPTASLSVDDQQAGINEEELAWCIHQLKLSLHAKKLTSKLVNAIRKDIAILENPDEIMVKKRCLMKMSLGDYRKKMEIEKQKVSLGLKNAAIVAVPLSTGQFMKKSTRTIARDQLNLSIQLSDNSFRFNFDRRQLNE